MGAHGVRQWRFGNRYARIREFPGWVKQNGWQNLKPESEYGWESVRVGNQQKEEGEQRPPSQTSLVLGSSGDLALGGSGGFTYSDAHAIEGPPHKDERNDKEERSQQQGNAPVYRDS